MPNSTLMKRTAQTMKQTAANQNQQPVCTEKRACAAFYKCHKKRKKHQSKI